LNDSNSLVAAVVLVHTNNESFGCKLTEGTEEGVKQYKDSTLPKQNTPMMGNTKLNQDNDTLGAVTMHLRADVSITDVVLRHSGPKHLQHISQRHVGARLRLKKRTNIAQNVLCAGSARSLNVDVNLCAGTTTAALQPLARTVVPVLRASMSIWPVRGSVADF
jgi:hypothetical protein